jgi:predicted nucleic acid-binding protein
MNLPPKVFVDTTFFIALLNSNDNDHARAVALQAQLSAQRTRKVTSEYVLLELGDGLSRLRFRHLVQQIFNLIYQDTTFEVVVSSSGLFNRSLTLFNQRPDKEWGLTDCSSSVIMAELGLSTALTADHHFKQAGYQALLLESATS